MKGKIKAFIGSVLIILGICLIGVTLWMKYETKKEQQELVDNFKNLPEVSEGIENASDKNNNSEENNNISEDKKIKENKRAIALINIPKLNLEAGIVEGVKIEDIKYSVGHFPNTPMAGEKGNFCIAAHRVSNYGQAFRYLDKLELGDEIQVLYKGKQYIYEVTDSFEVTPQETHVLDNTENSTITLVTCTIGAKNRLIVKGKLKI